MRRVPSALIVGLALALHASLPTPGTAQRTADPTQLAAHLSYLSADAREGRGIGTVGLDSAASYLAQTFASLGLQMPGSGGFFQTFTIDPSATMAAHSDIGNETVRNVVGILPGSGALAEQAIVIGAHYDHLGYGGSGSLDPDSAGVIHNGADDNASGTAALLEVARLLAQREAGHRRTLIFVAFTAEELGLIGSAHYVKNPPVPLSSTYAMINFDMVGRLRDGRLLAIGTGSARELPQLLEAVNGTHGLTLRPVEDPWGRSDHSSFYGESVPVLHFFTDTHEDYHRTTDDWPKLNIDGLARIAEFAADLVWTLATRDESLTFVNVPRPPPATGGGGYGTYLGTIPDMSESPGGVRLTGVRAGSPAEAAGLRKGDVLIQLGEHTIGNLYDMVEALRAYKPGEVVTLVVLRDGERIEATATLDRRGG